MLLFHGIPSIFLKQYCVVYTGDRDDRQNCRDNDWWHDGSDQLKFHVLVTSYEIFKLDN